MQLTKIKYQLGWGEKDDNIKIYPCGKIDKIHLYFYTPARPRNIH